MSTSPRNLNRWMSIHDPQRLQALLATHPDSSSLFRIERDMGGKAVTTAPLLPAMMDLADAGIVLVQSRLDLITGDVVRRIARVESLKSGASIVSAIASAGLVVSLAKVMSVDSDGVKFALATLTLTGSMLTLFAERVSGGANGGRLRKQFDIVVAASRDLLKMQQKWQRSRLTPEPTSVALTLSELDAISLQLLEVEMNLKIK